MQFYTKHPKHARREGKPVFIETPMGQRCIGHLTLENKRLILVKVLQEKKHLCGKHGGWGIDRSALELLGLMDVDAIRVYSSDTEVTEEATLADYTAYGISDDLGCGQQVFLPRRYFHRLGGQMGLFGSAEQ